MQHEAGTPLLEVGQRLEPLEIIDMTVQGGGVARYQGQVVFLESGIVGETVAARITQVKKRVVQASVEQVLRPSPHAVAPTCPHFALCGGCSWQNLSLAAQHEWKQRHVRETLARIGKAVIDVAPVAASPLSLGFRNKVAFAFSQGPEGAPVLGLRHSVDRPGVGLVAGEGRADFRDFGEGGDEDAELVVGLADFAALQR